MVSRYVRTGGALGHLLLVVLLALGIFAMHSTGHPGESPTGAAMSAGSHTTTMDEAAPDRGPMSAPVDTGMDTSSHTKDPADPSATHRPAMAMDMASLCVAVLFGAWVLAKILTAAFARHHERPAELRAQFAVLRPDPPPRGPDLTLLSVLRL